MAKDVIIDNLQDEGLIRLWEAVMEQVAVEYIDLYILYLQHGSEATRKYCSNYGRHQVTAKRGLIELEDYILGDLIAGPHASYIVHKLRQEAKDAIVNGKRKRIPKRKEIMGRG